MDSLLKKYIQSYMNVICQNGFYGSTVDIPRPNRLKKPENYYGSTGRNAKDYDLYIQDEAQAVFQDKYGREKGHDAWYGIIGVGNAMWKACDEILGERQSMQSDLTNWFDKHTDIEQQCTDKSKWLNRGFYDGSYIVDWVWWILTQIIDGKRFTHDYISNCIPTFKGVLNAAPITTKVLLEAAGIDVQNYTLSKKVQAKIDAEKAKAEEEKRIADEKAAAEQKRNADRQQIIDEFLKICNELKQAGKFYNNIPNIKADMFDEKGAIIRYSDINMFTKVLRDIFRGNYDISVGLKNLLELPIPTNKDEQRIYDIIAKSKRDLGGFVSVLGLDPFKPSKLASNMNAKITGEEKRQARKNAALKYGLPFLAKYFE